MRARLFAPLAALIALAAPLGVRAQEPTAIENPYKNAKVGDYATYTMTMKVGGNDLTGTITNKVTAKTEKEATLVTSGTMAGQNIPPQTQKIDLTKAFDPSKAGLGGAAGKNADAKVETTGTGKEKVTVGGKSYDTTWTTMKVKTKTPVGDVDADVKAWIGKDVPLGLVRMEMTTKVAGMEIKMEMVQTESGNKK